MQRRDPTDITWIPLESGWSCVTWIVFYLFFTLLGQRSPDDRLWARDEPTRSASAGFSVLPQVEGVVLRRPRGVPRWLRPGLAAAAAALCGGAAYLVHRDGGWIAQSIVLGVALAALGCETLWQWTFAAWLWLRLSLLLKLASLGLHAAALVLLGQQAVLAAALALPQLAWVLYTLADSTLILLYNRHRVTSELEAAQFVGAGMLDAEPASGVAEPRSVGVVRAVSTAE